MTVRPRLRATAWCGTLAAGMVVLAAAEMPGHDATGMAAVVATVRVAGLAVGGYLTLTSVLRVGVVGQLAGPLVRAVDALTLPVVRRMLDAALGGVAVLSVASGPVAAAGNAAAAAAETPPVLRHLEESEGPAAGSVSVPAPNDARPPVESPAARSSWTVEPGDHLWSIAERVLTERLYRAPGQTEVADYWADLIDANRSRLAHPAVPDLIYPGQVFVLPGSGGGEAP